MSGSVPAQEQTLIGLGKQVNELISPDTSIDFTGAVKGTLNYIKEWSDFSSDPAEQTGHFFPVHIDDKYSGKEITCTGEKVKTADDLDWVLFVEGNDSTFKFTCEGKTILTLSFAGATFAPDSAVIRQTARRAVKKSK